MATQYNSVHDLEYQHNPGIQELAGEQGSPSFSRRIFLGGAALGAGVLFLKSKGLDLAGVPEANGSVFDSMQGVEGLEGSLPASSQERLNGHLGAIDAMRPIYEAVEHETGVPWMFMAAIHYREGSNRPDASMYAGERLGTKNPDFGDVKGSDIFRNGIMAAEHFKRNAKTVYGIDIHKDMHTIELACAFLAYNRGSMYRNASRVIGTEMSPDQSPYVMNGYDEQHLEMTWPAQGNYDNSGLKWGEPQSVQGKRNIPLGALAVVKGLQHREQGGEAVSQRKVVIIGDSLSVGDDKYAKIQDVDGYAGKQIIHYDAAGSRPLLGVNDGLAAIKRAMPHIEVADTLVLALGTNMPESEDEFKYVLTSAASNIQNAKPGIKIVIPQIIGFEGRPKMEQRRDARNGIIQRLADEGLVTYLPLNIPASMFEQDGFHLTVEGYKQRASQILQAA